MISAHRHKSKSISNFFEKKSNFCFHVVVPSREDLSIDVTIINLGLILTKLRTIQLFGTCQNPISNFFEKKLGFHVVVLLKTLSFMYQLLM